MNKTTLKTVHAIARVLEGDYSARLVMAWAIVKGERYDEVAELIDMETLTPKAFVAPVHTVSATPVQPAKSKMPKKERGQRRERVQRTKAEKVVEFVPPLTFAGLPQSILENFSSEECDTIEEMIKRYIDHANKFEGDYRLAKKWNMDEGMEKLAKVTDLEGLQIVMVTYFLRDYAEKVIKKTLEMGIGYKKLNKLNTTEQIENHEEKNSYMQASSNRGNIMAFEVDDIMNDLIVDAYRLTFSESMFESPVNVMASIFYRISNVVQSRMRELRNQTKVVTAKKQYVQEEGASISTEEEALQMAMELGIFSDAELEIIKLRVEGFQKKEIDKMFGKRTDRDFKRMEKLYKQAQ